MTLDTLLESEKSGVNGLTHSILLSLCNCMCRQRWCCGEGD